MKRTNFAKLSLLLLGLPTFVATASQCRDGGSQDPGTKSSAAARGGTGQDPQAGDGAGKNVPPPPDALRILISGSMLGRLEPCGCASGQLGGLARRMQHIGEQRNYDLLLEGGDLVEDHTELDSYKLLTTAMVLFQMEHPYDALGIGPRDLEMPFDEWAAYLTGAPVVATNLSSDDPMWPGKPLVEKQVRDKTVRIGSLLLETPPALQQEGARVRVLDPATAWRSAFEGDAQAGDDGVFRIAMLHGGDAAIRALAPQLNPRPDLVVGVDPAYIEPDTAATSAGGVPLVFAGIRGRVLLDARLWREGDQPRVACERVPLTGSQTVPGGGGDPAARDAILQHRRDVAAGDVLTNMARQHPTPNGAEYIGTQACAGCHAAAMEAWKKTKHAHAWQTLVDAEKDPERYGWPVTQYPDCVDCHVVGYGEKSGFVNYEQTPLLADVGCERCHGPGSQHIQNPAANKLGIIGDVLPSQMCVECHDFEQSPNFVYSERWKLIEHGK